MIILNNIKIKGRGVVLKKGSINKTFIFINLNF